MGKMCREIEFPSRENKQEKKKKTLWKHMHRILFEVRSVMGTHRFYKILIVFFPCPQLASEETKSRLVSTSG